jgi:hypothetical protein
MRHVKFLTVVLAIVAMASITSAQLVDEDFDSLDVGANPHSLDGWEGWYGDASVGGSVTDEQAFSGSHSLRFTRPADLVPYWPSPGSGNWILVTMQYVPSAATGGDAYYGVLSSYEAGTAGSAGWITEVISDFATDDVRISGGETNRVPLVRDAWAEIKVALDFDAQEAAFYYNGELLGTREATSLSGLDLWANSDDVMYFDDFWLGTVQMFGTQAKNLFPEDGVSDVLREAGLNWEPGSYADKHDVYFGTVLDDVSSADRDNPMDVLVSQGQSQTSYEPEDRLEFGQTYYWRIDEVNEAPDNTIFKGAVWSFVSEPYSIPVETITVTASSSNAADMGPEKTIDGSGLNELDQHGTDATTMWLSGPGGNPWIQYDFDKVYKLDELLVWNSNQVIESFLGLGAKDVVIESSVDGAEWTVLEGVTLFNQATGAATYTANTIIDFAGTLAQSVRISISSGYGMMPQYGLSEVRFLTIPTDAREPQPLDGMTADNANVVLAWRSGREAASSEVYLGTDAADLGLLGTTTENSITASGLNYSSTYFWSVTEVNEAEAIPSYAGDVWSFTIPDSGAVDNFEQYDDNCQRIFFGWEDGLGHNGSEACAVAPYNGNGSGSIVGNGDAPFAEQGIVHSGIQSMPFSYDGPSEATLNVADLPIGQDWTKGSPTALVLWVRGDLSIAPADQLYVKLNNTKVVYDGDLSVPIWQQWNIDLAATGANLSNITTLSIGVDGSGSGILYLDDIALYRTAPPVVDPPSGPDRGLVGHWKLDEAAGLNAADSSGYGSQGTLVGMTGTEWTTGTLDGALGFNGSAQYVDCGSATNLQLAGSATISAWVKMGPGSADAYMGIAGKMTANPYDGFALVRHSSNAFRLWVGNLDGDNLTGISSDVTYSDTDWHHVVGVISDGTSSLYVDGVKQTEEAPVRLADTGDFAYIGKQYSNTDERYWNGDIDDVRIYYRALSAQEISGL